jgi:hypothetical protein
MVNGVWTGNVMLTKAESYINISVQDRTNPPHTGYSNQFNVVAGQISKLQVLLPGESTTPGISPGKKGTVNDILAGSSINVRVNAVDAFWNVITNSSDVVHFVSSDPLAGLPPDSPLNMGTRQVVITLNSTGLQTVSAFDLTSPQVSPATSTQIRVNPGNLDHFVFDQIYGPKFVGTPFSVKINAVDLLGNLVSAYSGLVTLSASTGDGTIVPVTANFINGTWMGNITLKKAAGGVFLHALDNATPPHSGTSKEFEVKPGTLAGFQVIVPGLSATPGVSPGYMGTPKAQNVGRPFSININGVDEYWNVVTTANDSFGVSSTDILASLPEPAKLNFGSKNLSITLNEDGSHTISAFHLNNQQVLNGQTPLITVLPQNLDHFSFNQISDPVVVGQPFQITTRAETNENDRVFGFQGNLNLSASTGDGTIIPKIIGPFEDGEWTGEIILTLASNEVRLFANDGGTPSHTGTSNPFTVLSGDFKKLQVLLPGENPQAGSFLGKTGLPLDQQTGEQFEVIIRAVDEYWNLVSSINDSIKIQSSDSLAIFTKKSKMINGSASLSFIMGSAGRHIITAEDITDIEKLAGISSSFNINPGNLDHFELQTISDQIAGNEFSITITAADVADNPVTGFNGHARLKSSTGDDTFSPSEIDFVDGVWTGKLIVTRASENVYLTCLDFAANPHTGQSNLFKINPGEFTRLQILLNGETSTPGIAPGKTGNIQTQIAGEAVLVTVNAVDNWWNPIPSANGSIELTSTDINANLPMDADLISGTVTFSDMRFLTPGYWTITSHCRSNPQISSDTSPLVHVITGSIASFTFEAINSPQVVGDTISVTIRAVDGNGTTVSAYSEKASVTVSTGPGTIIIEGVQFQNGVWSGPVVLTRAAQSVHFNIHDFDDIVRGNSNPFTLLPGNLARLQILLPGEIATPGLNQAKEGQPHSQIVGVPFQIKVNATDKWWNQVKPDNLNLHFSSSDMIANLPKDTSQTTSFSNYTITLLTVGDNKIIAQSNDRPELVDTSSVVYVQSGQLDHFVFSKIDNVQKAGHAISVRIDAHNQFDFPVTDYQGDIILSASTGNGTISKTGIIMTNGYWEGELYVTKADSNVNLFASDYIPSPNTHTGYSNSFSVQSDSLAGLQVILPGETITPGVTPGKRGDPLTNISGTSVNIMFRAVDSYWNLISNRTDTLTIAVTDSFAILPDIVKFENGFTEIPITFRTANRHQIIANFVNPKSFAEAKSDTLQIFPNVFTQLLLLLPGEQLLPGDNENDPLKTPGRIGQALKQTSGLPFNVEILAVDNYWNQVVDSPSDKIHLFTTDNLAKISPIDTVLQRGKAWFSVTLTQGGNQVLRAINDSNAQIRTSLDGVVGVLVGGLHYEVVLSTDKIAAGYEFNMQIFYKNGIGELVASANHLVHLSLVNANDVSQTLGTLNNNSFDLQGGSRIIKQIINSVGLVRIKVEDEIGTQPAYSDPLEVFAGDVTSIQIDAPRSEIRGLEEVTLSAKLADHAGNPVSNYEVQFSVISGSGELKQPTGLSDPEGMVSVGFKAGRISELNIVRAQVDTIFADFEILTNLTPSTQPDGIPVNYPNPFGVESDFTSIDYYLAEDADVTLQIYDLFGNFVWSKNISAGTPGGLGRSNSSTPNSVPWQGLNDQGQKVGNGGYILVAIAVANGKTIMNAQRKIAVLR